MKIKPIKPNQVSNCRYCKAEGNKVPSKWHLTLANIQTCDDHKHLLQEMVDAENQEPRHYSEADYQTWMRH